MLKLRAYFETKIEGVIIMLLFLITLSFVLCVGMMSFAC